MRVLNARIREACDEKIPDKKQAHACIAMGIALALRLILARPALALRLILACPALAPRLDATRLVSTDPDSV